MVEVNGGRRRAMDGTPVGGRTCVSKQRSPYSGWRRLWCSSSPSPRRGSGDRV